MIYKFKYAVFAFLALALLVISCSKDEPINQIGGDQNLNSRSSTSLEVNYDLKRVTMIDPEHGDFQDMCMGDIRMLNELTRLYQVTSKITHIGEVCIEIIKNKKVAGFTKNTQGSDGRSQEGFEYESTSKYCDNILTYMTRDTTITKSVTVNFEFWKKVVEGYLYTDTEIREHFVTMIEVFKQNGATVIENDFTVSVTETSPSGEQFTSVYNKHTNLLMYTELKDAHGNVKKTFAYEYTCSPDGKIIPKSIYIKTTDTSTICKAPFEKKEWLMFENFSVSI